MKFTGNNSTESSRDRPQPDINYQETKAVISQSGDSLCPYERLVVGRGNERQAERVSSQHGGKMLGEREGE